MDDMFRTRRYRFLETLPGATSWLMLLVPLIAARWFPRAVAIFITIYVIFWFLRAVKSSVFLLLSFRKSKFFQTLDWHRMLAFFSDAPPEPTTAFERETAERVRELREASRFMESKNIFHVVIMPTYKEEKEILESSLEALTKVDFPLDHLIIVLATEERDRGRAEANAAYLGERFGTTFGQFHHIMHPANLPNEIPAKGANITYAARALSQKLIAQGLNPEHVLVTTLDADNRPHPLYFSILTFHYLFEPERKKKSFQPLSFFYNNIWEVPFANRLIALANTFWYLSESGESHHLFNASVYAQSLAALMEMDFWSRHTIVEDLHQYWRAYFHFGGDHEVVALFIPVYQDALQNRTYFTSLLGQYRQLRRWAWGCSEIPYAIAKTTVEWKRIPRVKTVGRIAYLWYLQLMWATAPIIIFLNKSIPSFANPRFSNSVFAYNLGTVINGLFTVMLFGIAISFWISALSLPRPPGRFAALARIGLVLHWFLLPFVTLLYGAIPALDAQTRLMLGKRLPFGVTEKIRKIS